MAFPSPKRPRQGIRIFRRPDSHLEASESLEGNPSHSGGNSFPFQGKNNIPKQKANDFGLTELV
jgi:hypothetical protein